MKIVIPLFFFVITFTELSGQADSIPTDTIIRYRRIREKEDCRYFHRHCSHGYYWSSRTISLVPQVQLGEVVYSLGISHILHQHGEYGGGALTINTYFGYMPNKKLYAVSLDLLASVYLVIPGVSLGLKGTHYFNQNNKVWALRPEIGLNFISYLHFTYGYNLFFNTNDVGLKNGTFTISLFFPPVYPWK